MDILNSAFLNLVAQHGNNEVSEQLWHEISSAYSHKSRHYHNLNHLENLLRQLNQVKSQITDWDTILFTLFYHDIVYNALKHDNEDRSATLAEKRMRELNVAEIRIERCKQQILATKGHQVSYDVDTNYFTDADLSILGADWDLYSEYAKNIRKEYSIYPDLIYNAGRKKVLNHFLGMERVFKTSYFYEILEERAKHNLRRELARL